MDNFLAHLARFCALRICSQPTGRADAQGEATNRKSDAPHKIILFERE
jgi:hypothetical protein